MKKKIIILRNIDKHIGKLKKDTCYNVKILKTGIVGGFERYPQDNTMEGCLEWSVLVEFESGEITSFILDYDICILTAEQSKTEDYE